MQVVCGITLTTPQLLRQYVDILIFYMRMPDVKDSMPTMNVYQTTCQVKINNMLNIRIDIDCLQPWRFPIFMITQENSDLHKRVMCGVEGLTRELGKHPDDD